MKKIYFVLYELVGLNRQYLLQVFLFLEHFCQITVHNNGADIFFMNGLRKIALSVPSHFLYFNILFDLHLNPATSYEGLPNDPQ